MAGPIGAFVWYEYMGEDRLAAADFYGRVLGWTVKDAGLPNLPYETASVGDRMVAGLMEIPDDARAMGVRPCWTGYVWVEDVDAALPDFTRAGGRVWKQPAEFPGIGRFAVVADPYGGGVVLFRGHGDGPPPAPPENAPGFVGWRELHADDGASALDFYCRLFGWRRTGALDMGPMGAYEMFETPHGERGGILTRQPGAPASHWLYYFNVEAIDAAAERVRAHGGRIVNSPHQVPSGQWVVQAVDPQGAMFALVAPKR